MVVYVTAPGKEVARALARGLVQEKYAACVNIVPGACPGWAREKPLWGVPLCMRPP